MKTTLLTILLTILYSFCYPEIPSEKREEKFNVHKLYDALDLCEGDKIFNLKLFAHETAYFTSDYFLDSNNICGMQYAQKRYTTAKGWFYGDVGKKSKVAKYHTWEDSLADFIFFQEYYKKRGIDMSNYKAFIEKYFNTLDPEYTKKVEKVNLKKLGICI
jgi:hypothetical protein